MSKAFEQWWIDEHYLTFGNMPPIMEQGMKEFAWKAWEKGYFQRMKDEIDPSL